MKYITACMLVILFYTACGVLSTTDEDVSTELKIESTKISNIKDIEGTFTIRNNANESKTYNFSSGCQVGFKILKKSAKIFDTDKKLVCTRALTSLSLEKGESKSLLLPLDFDIELETGDYIIESYLIGYQKVNASQSFEVK